MDSSEIYLQDQSVVEQLIEKLTEALDQNDILAEENQQLFQENQTLKNRLKNSSNKDIIIQKQIQEIDKLIRENQETVTKMRSNEQKLQSANRLLETQLQKITEKNELLNNEEKILQQKNELQTQNEKLQKENARVIQEKETTVQAYKKKNQELDRREKLLAGKENNLEARKTQLEEGVERRAEEISRRNLADMTTKYRVKMGNLDEEFKLKTAAHATFFTGCLLYGILMTTFTAVRSERFVSDFKAFFVAVWGFVRVIWQIGLNGAIWASKMSERIPQDLVAGVVRFLSSILLFVIVVGGVLGLIGFCGYHLVKFYREYFADKISLAVILTSLAAAVFFAEQIRSIVPINLMLLVVLSHGVYMIVRMMLTRKKSLY